MKRGHHHGVTDDVGYFVAEDEVTIPDFHATIHAALGIDPAFVARMMGMAPDAWEYVESSQSFLELKVCPVGLDKLSSNLAAIATNICNHAASGMGYATPQQARLLSPRDARRHLLESVRDTAQAMGTANTTDIAAVSLASSSEFTNDST